MKDLISIFCQMLIVETDNGKEFRISFTETLNLTEGRKLDGKLQRFLKFERQPKPQKNWLPRLTGLFTATTISWPMRSWGFSPYPGLGRKLYHRPGCEIIDVREDEKSLVLKFTNRNGNKSRIELKMIA
jgi:hypothetical protein